jgi:hypothetical protein
MRAPIPWDEAPQFARYALARPTANLVRRSGGLCATASLEDERVLGTSAAAGELEGDVPVEGFRRGVPACRGPPPLVTVPGGLGLPPIYAVIGRAYARAMGARSSRRLAWTLGTVSVGLVAVAAAFDVVNAAHDRADPWLPSIAAAAVGFGAVGGLVAAQQRRNPIGWMLLAIGVGHAVSGAAIGYGTWAATTGRAGAGGDLWLGSWAWLPLAGLPAVLLLFPTGRLRSRRLRPVLLVALALPPLLIAGSAVHPQRLLEDPLSRTRSGSARWRERSTPPRRLRCCSSRSCWSWRSPRWWPGSVALTATSVRS